MLPTIQFSKNRFQNERAPYWERSVVSRSFFKKSSSPTEGARLLWEAGDVKVKKDVCHIKGKETTSRNICKGFMGKILANISLLGDLKPLSSSR
jgi:hypothetical protein